MTALFSANTNKLQLSSLDFDDLKASLISFLQSQNTFSDYNFTGSGLNVLLDILVYNTHLQSFYLNMVANEMWLDTCVLRSSAVSHAKSLGYTPQSVVGAEAIINVSIVKVNTDPTTFLTMPRFTQFTSSALNGQSYNFLTLDDVDATTSGNTFYFNNLMIKEGSPALKTYIVDNSQNPTQMFDLVDVNIDTSSIQVIVQNSLTNTLQNTFTLAEDATTVTANSNIYFIEEGMNANYIIYFGDGIIGTRLSDGNIVIISYLITNADAANQLQTFALQTNLLSGSVANVTTISGSAGGSNIENVNSIKFTAPKSWIAQNRAVTENDYISLINKNYPYFDAVTIWGGQKVNPPVYGVVYVSAKPKSGYAITTQQIQFVLNSIIAPFSMLTVTPIWVDADYNYLRLNLDVEYDSTQTTLTQKQLENEIISAVQNYANLNINTFNSVFKLSRLLRAVDDSDNSIDSSSVQISLEKRLIPTLNTMATYTMNTGIQLQPDTLYSSPAFIVADNGGVLRQAFIEEIPNSFSGISTVSILAPGIGYTTPPYVVISGDGTGANAYPVVVNGSVQSIVVDNQGSEYTTATAIIKGNTGSGAILQVILQGTNGILRTYYYDNNNNKVFINTNAGTIDYLNGVITLVNFSPISISDSEGSLSISIAPVNLVFGSTFNRIITIDPNDPNSVIVNLQDINQ